MRLFSDESHATVTLTAILDTTLLSNFAHVQRPDLLRLALGESAAMTPMVQAELEAGESQGHIPLCDWSWLLILTPTDLEHCMATRLLLQLDPGEAECLAVAFHRQCMFLSDDLAARRVAQKHKLTVSGSVGVLRMLIANRYLSLEEADELLATMISHGYRSPVRSFQQLL